jgi:hypothetical protein
MFAVALCVARVSWSAQADGRRLSVDRAGSPLASAVPIARLELLRLGALINSTLGTPKSLKRLNVQRRWRSRFSHGAAAMKTAITIAGTCLLLGLANGPAGAGACTSEIENLAKAMAAADAGSGPTSGAAASATIAPRSSDTVQHPPTGRMSQETQGKATSPEDVRRQTEGRPTASEQAQGGKPSSTDKAEASAALGRARNHDRDGREAECMDAIQQARRLSGS